MFFGKQSIKYRLSFYLIGVLSLFVIILMTIYSILTYQFEHHELQAEVQEELEELLAFGIKDITQHIHPLVREEFKEMHSHHQMSVRVYHSQTKQLYFQSGLFQKPVVPELLNSTSSQLIPNQFGDDHFFVTQHSFQSHRQPVTLEIWIPTFELWHKVIPFLTLMGITLVIGIGIGIPVIFAISNSITRPIRDLEIQVQKMNSTTLSTPITFYTRDDELGHLIAEINNLKQRLHQCVEDLKSFSSQLSHEIRAPLAAIMSKLPAIPDPTLKDQLTQSIRWTQETLDAIRYYHLVQQNIYPIETSIKKFHFILQPLISIYPNRFDISGLPNISIETDHTLLRIILKNIIENAIKHSVPNSKVTLSYKRPTVLIKNQMAYCELAKPSETQWGTKLIQCLSNALDIPYIHQINNSTYISSFNLQNCIFEKET